MKLYTEADGGKKEREDMPIPIGSLIQLDDGREVVKVDRYHDSNACRNMRGVECLFYPDDLESNRLCAHFHCDAAMFISKHDYLALKLIGEEP